MKVTNRLNLPKEVVQAVMADTYSHRGDISVTALLSPPRIRILRKRHWEEIEEDLTDRLWALYGQIVHGILERTDDWEAFHEERLCVQLEGWTVTGQADLYKRRSTGQHVLRDYKFTSVFVVRGDSVRPEWAEQVNIYAWMWRKHGFQVDEAQLVLLFRDWRKREFERSSGAYPPPVKIIDVPLWADQFTEAFVTDRIRLHREAEETPDDLLPLCTAEDRWERGGGWAVIKKGRKRALRVFECESEAVEFMGQADQPGLSLVERPSEPVRCLYFCNVSQFCDFGRTQIARDPA